MKAYRWAHLGLAASAIFLAASCATVPPEGASSSGFTSLFDGATLNGWRGDPVYWSVQDGAITGRAEGKLDESPFLIREGSYGDFELHFKYRMTEKGNSGFQFRSTVRDEAKFIVAGYQANVVPAHQEVRFGMIYENLGRNEIALLSENVEISSVDGKLARTVRSSVNPVKTLLATYRPYPEWNDYVVIARGNRIIQVINGHLAVDAVDNAPQAAREGVFALQVDRFDTPMMVQFKDIAVRRLTSEPDLSRFIANPGPPETGSAIPPRPRRQP
jgi:hypothetical protein